jgi:hypothetical protein
MTYLLRQRPRVVLPPEPETETFFFLHANFFHGLERTLNKTVYISCLIKADSRNQKKEEWFVYRSLHTYVRRHAGVEWDNLICNQVTITPLVAAAPALLYIIYECTVFCELESTVLFRKRTGLVVGL